MAKTHIQLAQEIEKLESQILSMDDIQANRPDVIIKTVGDIEIIIKENHDQFCLAMRAFLGMILEKRKDEVRLLLDDRSVVSTEELSKKKKVE